MSSTTGSSERHPGFFIRENVIPKGMSVTKAAKLVDIGRPALSNLLNGHATLSAEMATKLERTFGTNAKDLMTMQASFDAKQKKSRSSSMGVQYVPPFLQVKADDISAWASHHSARSRLAVFLRMLVNSTGRGLRTIDFPGNDDSERPGWDGTVYAEEATPWIPEGQSGWEFGCSDDPTVKANKDFAKSLRQNSAEARKEMTFVFVTPHRWKKKRQWEEEQRKKSQWKDVTALDASDLEQWLEQSISAQCWLAYELGIPTDGVLSLNQCWAEWIADCDPPMTPSLFSVFFEKASGRLRDHLTNPPGSPFIVSADSTSEAQAFLHCLFSPENEALSSFRDRIIVFSKPGALPRLVSKSSNFIPVIVSREVEKEFAPLRTKIHSILVYPRNATSDDPDIELEPLGYEQFEKSLQEMACSRHDIDRLSHESGRSLTVLRRRLSKLQAIQTPKWASDSAAASTLVPFFFAGAWNSKSPADQTVLSFLAGERKYDALEKDIGRLEQLEDAPVWRTGGYRGVVSKIDVLFGISKHIVSEELTRFIHVAELVLSEDDPALDLPEDQRWMAAVYKKTRDISTTLRDGIGESLVLLVVHGNQLFSKNLGIDIQSQIGNLIRNLLSPLTTRMLEAHIGDLPMYAEAAPEEFLKIIEHDLDQENPASLGLMRPVSPATFGRCYRTGLLWALENIAWSPGHFLKCVTLLARLAQVKIDDNWVNKPISTLESLFRCWMPQTAANVDQRIAAFSFLAENYPDIAWEIACQQFNGRHSVGHYNHKPRWRTDARGYGEPVTRAETYKFVRYALDLALAWKNHTRETLADLVESVNHLDEEDQEKIWSLVLDWQETTSDEDKAWLREKVRQWGFSRRALVQARKFNKSKKNLEQPRHIYDILQPDDVVLRHEWLFRNDWLDPSADEYEEEYDFKKSKEKLKHSRIEAMRSIMAKEGIDGIVRLADLGNAAFTIGFLLCIELLSGAERLKAINHISAQRELTTNRTAQNIVVGIFAAMTDVERSHALNILTRKNDDALILQFFKLAPFDSKTWQVLDQQRPILISSYWSDVSPRWVLHSENEIITAVEALLLANRPRAAFCFSGFEVEKIPAHLLFRILKEIAIGSKEEPGTYQLEQYQIKSAFEALNASGEVSVEEMAQLEFLYLDVFYRGEDRIPNLEKQIEKHPDLFVQALAYAYKRRDDNPDPSELRSESVEALQRRAETGYKLLAHIRRIPGHDERTGTLTTDGIVDWIGRARKQARHLARLEMCDFSIGKILSHAPKTDDGLWPCEIVRDAIEKVYSPSLHDGIENGLISSRGVVWRGAGGNQERELAAQYQKWADAVEYTHPRLASILQDVVKFYLDQAEWEDTEATLQKRLR